LSAKEDEDWPVFKLFKAGRELSQAETYPADEKVTTSNLIKWVVKETGAFISSKVCRVKEGNRRVQGRTRGLIGVGGQ
jgi:hypothetical protein